MNESPKLLDRVRMVVRLQHYSLCTEVAYVDWVRRFVLFHGKRHPLDMGAEEVTAFLTHLAVERKVSASTQNQARSALLFLYKAALEVELPWLDDVVIAKRGARLPVADKLGHPRVGLFRPRRSTLTRWAVERILGLAASAGSVRVPFRRFNASDYGSSTSANSYFLLRGSTNRTAQRKMSSSSL